MNWLIDIILLAVIGFTAFRHFRFGLMFTVYNIGRFILSVLAAVIFGKLFGRILADGFLGDRLRAGGHSDVFADRFCAVISYLVIFIVATVILSFVVKILCKIEIPILHELNKVLGLILGLLLGLLSASMIATILYSFFEMYASFSGEEGIMSVYYDSYIFRFVYNLKIFGFIRSLL